MELSSLQVNVPGNRRELNITSTTDGGQLSDGAYSMEMIYSSSDNGYHSRDEKTWQPGTAEAWSTRTAGENLAAAAADENGVLRQNVFTFYSVNLGFVLTKPEAVVERKTKTNLVSVG